jgi:hypothetical protein
MKILLLALLALNIMFFFVSQHLRSERGVTPKTVSKTDKGIPELRILRPGDSVFSVPTGAKSVGQISSRSPAAKKPVSAKKPAPRIAAPAKDKTPAASKDTKLSAYTKPGSQFKTLNLQCVTLGPFIDKDDAYDLNEQLQVMDVRTKLRSEQKREEFWVYLKGKSVNDSPRTVVAMLKRNRIRHKLTKKRKRGYVISLGVFRNQEGASRRLKELTQLGLRPKLKVSGSKDKQIWVDYYLPRGKKLPKNAAKLINESKSENYLKQRACNRRG